METGSDSRAAWLSAFVPGSGQLLQGRRIDALTAFIATAVLSVVCIWLGRVTDRAVEVLVFMVLALPSWALQSYDAYLGRSTPVLPWLRNWHQVWRQRHD